MAAPVVTLKGVDGFEFECEFHHLKDNYEIVSD